MRIGQVTPYFHPHLGGVESHVRDLSRKLVGIGHEIHVVTSRYEPHLFMKEDIDNFRVHRLPTRAIIAKTPLVKAMKPYLETLDLDILHAHSPPPLLSYYSARFAQRHDIPFVYTYHCDMEIPMIGGKYIVSLYRRLYERKTIKWTDSLICTTHSYAATSRSTWDRIVNVIPNAVDTEFFRPDILGNRIRERHNLQDKTIALFVGRIVHHKGIETLIMSAKHTKEPVHYLIVGTGEEKERLERMAREVDAKRIIFTGPVPRKELPEYYAAADMLILPSISRLEAFGIVGLEAMASGKPVVLSRIPGVSEVIEEDREGVTFEPSDAEDLGKKIIELCAAPDLRHQMGMNGRKRVMSDYSMDRIVRDVEEIYLNVLAEREGKV